MIPESFDSDYSIIQVLISHIEQAQKNNLRQFKNCPNINDLLTILIGPLNKVQKDVLDLQKYMSLENGYGHYLDVLGKILGRGRQEEQSDKDYKHFLYTQILKNTNQTTINEVINILAKTLQADVQDNKVFTTEIFPAKVITTVESVDNILKLGGSKGIDSLLPAGVGLDINVFPEGCLAFGLEGSGGAPLDLGCWVSRYRELNTDYNPFGLDTGFPLDLGRFIDPDINQTIDPIQQPVDEEDPPPELFRDPRVLGYYPSGGEII
jgi:nitrogen regulatory protein PII